MSSVPATSTFRVRPCFEEVVRLEPEAVRARLLDHLALHAPGIEVRNFPGFIGLHLGDRERRFWSPRLFLVLDPTEEGGTRVRGTYGPEAEVWSVFLYGYLITGLLGTFSAVLGSAQLVVKTTPWGLWVLGAMATAALLLYLGAQLGQKLGAWQTFQLHQAYLAALRGSSLSPTPST